MLIVHLTTSPEYVHYIIFMNLVPEKNRNKNSNLLGNWPIPFVMYVCQ